MKDKILALHILLLLILATLIGLLLGKLLYSPTTPTGRILFWSKSHTNPYENSYFILNGDGNHIQSIGNYIGPPAWSPTGDKLALGCFSNNYGFIDDGKIFLCILDMNTLPDIWSPISESYNRFPRTLFTITLPDSCTPVRRDDVYWGISSLSWSRDGDRLAVVCDYYPLDSSLSYTEVCIIRIDGEMNCWDSSISKHVTHAVWSPTRDVLAISADAKIRIVNFDGSNPIDVADGFNPEWSPDGKHIAFIRSERMDTKTMDYGRWGIAQIDPNGENEKWLFLPGLENNINVPIGLYSCDSISWSPDGHFITFAAPYFDMEGPSSLFSLNVETGEIKFLVDRHVIQGDYSDPDWGP